LYAFAPVRIAKGRFRTLGSKEGFGFGSRLAVVTAAIPELKVKFYRIKFIAYA